MLTRPAMGAATTAGAQRTRGPRLPFGNGDFQPSDLKLIAATQGVAAWSGSLEVWDFGENSYKVVLGIDPTQDQVGPMVGLKDGLDQWDGCFEPGMAMLSWLTVTLRLYSASNRVIGPHRETEITASWALQSRSRAVRQVSPTCMCRFPTRRHWPVSPKEKSIRYMRAFPTPVEQMKW